MARSGRGRGHASFAFNMETTSFGKGAALPDDICKPPPPFPVSTASILERSLCSGKLNMCSHSCLENIMKYINPPKNFGFYNSVSHHFSMDTKPVPLKIKEDEDYILALKQDLRETTKKCHTSSQLEKTPREMKPNKAKKKGAKPKKAKNSEPKSNLDVIKENEVLEKKDEEKEKPEDEKDKEGEDYDEAEEKEEYDEEHEEENDYISSYFENGDGFGVVSDDNMVEET
ncbi:LOW QUALITY PROTEIN: DNA-directed RNA polymerase III subunit RPC7 [Motacilla alba alba]|uniref:LOW QUALITY PROTEIN: DNA-directed RNA polymerase III subunit RPC7 n=1 Tax=Motacilla alba alba TaxID=1094192 RepID=UPI0018D4F4AC|nr:LOW QUALITY PROTEIN: DNA-directed RNA polymerase III subunit RPC7 [Motacilla alba alba]